MAPDFDPVRFIRAMARNQHNGLIGLEYHGHSADSCKLKLPWREDLVGEDSTGIMASGPIITMMDMATSISVWLKGGKFRPQATLDLRVDYLRAAEPGKAVIGRGECYKITRSVAFVRGEAHDGDPSRPVAHVAGTFMFLDA